MDDEKFLSKIQAAFSEQNYDRITRAYYFAKRAHEGQKRKSGDDLLDFGRVRPTLSYTVGAGVVLLRHLLIDVRYNGQFRGKPDVALPNDVMLPEIRSYNVALSVGYLF